MGRQLSYQHFTRIGQHYHCHHPPHVGQYRPGLQGSSHGPTLQPQPQPPRSHLQSTPPPLRCMVSLDFGGSMEKVQVSYLCLCP